jgi:hypothetical protein
MQCDAHNAANASHMTPTKPANVAISPLPNSDTAAPENTGFEGCVGLLGDPLPLPPLPEPESPEPEPPEPDPPEPDPPEPEPPPPVPLPLLVSVGSTIALVLDLAGSTIVPL